MSTQSNHDLPCLSPSARLERRPSSVAVTVKPPPHAAIALALTSGVFYYDASKRDIVVCVFMSVVPIRVVLSLCDREKREKTFLSVT